MADDTHKQIAGRLAQAQGEMKAGNFDRAASIVAEILAEFPEHTDALYYAAVCARYQKKHSDAVNFLKRLKRALPEHGRAFQEEGHLLRAKAETDRAIVAYQWATRFNPALIASWTGFAELCASKGRHEEAREAIAQIKRLRALPRELLAVTNHIHEGRILKAEELARGFMQRNPRNVEGMRLLADIGTRLGVQDDADFLLETASELEPDNIQVRIDHIQVLRKRQKFKQALIKAKELNERDPENPFFLSLLAIEYLQSGDYEDSLETFDRVLEKVPNDPATLTSRGHALKTFGKTDEAIASYRAAIRSNPAHGEAWYSLANLKTFRFSDEERAQMKNLIASPDLTFMSRVNLNFALGKANEDASKYDEAFVYYFDGNSLKKRQTRYTTEQMKAEFSAQKEYCTSELFAKQSGRGHEAPDPIFIVGLPRAGSTLIEQILASHSKVDGTLELPNILSLAHRLRGRQQLTDRERYPRILHDLSPQQLSEFGKQYIEETKIHRAGAPFFTDKMPNNFRHIGLIHLILPNAKIIDARRNPMDCCWSGFKQLFAEGQEFSYGLEDIGEYYRAYIDLMEHWHSVLPEGRILHVQHEDVLDDLEGQVRRILDYCGLEFEQSCVDFHQNKRAVRTASSEQVRRPINKSGLEQWRPFEAHLGPLKQALGRL